MVLRETVPLGLGGKGRPALTTDEAQGVPQSTRVAEERDGSDIDQPQVDALPQQQIARAPAVRAPAPMPIQLIAIDGHGELEPVLLLISDR